MKKFVIAALLLWVASAAGDVRYGNLHISQKGIEGLKNLVIDDSLRVGKLTTLNGDVITSGTVTSGGPLTVINNPLTINGDLTVSGSVVATRSLSADSLIGTTILRSYQCLLTDDKLIAKDSVRTNLGIYVGGTLVSKIDGASATLNFGAPGAVPGSVDLTITLTGAALGDQPLVAAPITIGTNYVLSAFVSAANTVTVRWTQIAGAAADPDAGGGTYKVRIIR